MAAAAGGRTAVQIAGASLFAVTAGAISVIGLSQSGDTVVFLGFMAFQAAAFVAFDICQLTGVHVQCVVALPAAAVFQAFNVVFMGKDYLGSSQVAEYICMGQNVFFFLGHRHLPPGGADQYQTDEKGQRHKLHSHHFSMQDGGFFYHSRVLSTLPNSAPMYARENVKNNMCPNFENGMVTSSSSPASTCEINMGL